MHLLTWFFLLWPLAIICYYLGLSDSSLECYTYTETSHTSAFFSKPPVAVDFMAQSLFSGLVTQLPTIGLMAQSPSIGFLAQSPSIGLMAQSPSIGLMAQSSFSGLMTQLLAKYIGLMAQLSAKNISLMTQLPAKNINLMFYNPVSIGFMTYLPANFIIQPLSSVEDIFQSSACISVHSVWHKNNVLWRLNIMNYIQKIWKKLISSPLLEFYTKAIFVVLQIFDIVLKSDSSFWQCQKINLALRRHFYRHHNYAVLANKIKYYYAVLIHSTPIFINFFINYVFALKAIYICILKPLIYPILRVVHILNLLLHDTQHQIKLCFEDLSFSENKNTRAIGGGPSYELNYNDLCLYSNEVKANMKYIFHSYIPKSEINQMI